MPSSPSSVPSGRIRVLWNKNFSVTTAQIESVRRLAPERYEVWASHTDPTHGMCAAAEQYLTEPKGLMGPAYAQWLLQTCQAHGIEWLIAGKEREELADWQEAFAQAGVGLICVASRSVQEMLEQKDQFLAQWDQHILPIPRWQRFDDLAGFDAAWQALSDPQRRLCMKPAKGIYASGFRIITPQPQLEAFLRGELYHMSHSSAREMLGSGPIPPMLLMHTLEGAERSIDAVAWQGRLIGAVVRRKLAEAQIIEDRPDLIRAAEHIASTYQLSGIFNFQTKDQLSEAGEAVAHMLEINARASGGLTYSMAAGLPFALLLLEAATGQLNWQQLPKVQAPQRVYLQKSARAVLAHSLEADTGPATTQPARQST